MKKLWILWLCLLFIYGCDSNNSNDLMVGKVLLDSDSELQLEFKFNPIDSKKMKEYRFELKQPLESLELVHQLVEGEKSAIGNFGLAQGNTIVGWGKEAFYSSHYSSTITNMIELEKGSYALILEIGKLENPTTEIFTIKKTPYKKRWLRGTTHLHTYNSDGISSTKEVIDRALYNKFDYIFITDHNMTGSALMRIQKAFHGYTVKEHNTTIKESYAYRAPNLLMIDGVEWTSGQGHANFVGIDSSLLDKPSNAKERDANYYLKLARKNGAYVGINHPHAVAVGNSTWTWPWPKRELYDYVEIWNKRWNADNQKNLDWWHSQLQVGEKIPIVGGTDYHKDDNSDGAVESDNLDYFIMPVNKVLSPAFTQKAILDSVKAGQSVMFDGNLVDDVTFNSENGLIGTKTNENKVMIEVVNLKGNYDITLVSESGSKIIASNISNFKETVDVDFNKFCYLLIVSRDKSSVVAISNPVYR